VRTISAAIALAVALPSTSLAGAVVPHVPPTAPGAPTSVVAYAGNLAGEVTWSAPASNGGAAISSYTATASPGGATCTTPNGATRYCIVAGLTNGTAYSFTVTATNSVGTSSASSASNAVTPAPVADPPTAVTALSGIAQATVGWTAPLSDGGSSITSYTATAQPGGLSCTTPDGTTYGCIITGLTNGKTYVVTVTAANATGNSPPSGPVRMGSPVGAPSAPAAPSLSVGNDITVSWSVPSPGAAAIIGYRVVASPDGHICYSTLTTCLMTGLAHNLAYQFTVSAHSADGWSVPSSPSLTAYAIPTASPSVRAATHVGFKGAPIAVVVSGVPASTLVHVTMGTMHAACTTSTITQCAVSFVDTVLSWSLVSASYHSGPATTTLHGGKYYAVVLHMPATLSHGIPARFSLSGGQPYSVFSIEIGRLVRGRVISGLGAGSVLIIPTRTGKFHMNLNDAGYNFLSEGVTVH
jgi:hypothetical protein